MVALCVGASVCFRVCLTVCVRVCLCVWESDHVYLPVAKAISLQVMIRLIGVEKDRTLHSKDKVMINYFCQWLVA